MSPGATPDQRAAVEQFLKGSPKATPAIQTACVEICESRFDRVLLSVIDTPGLDFQEGRELKLERQVNAMLKYIDAQYADTMSEVRCLRSILRAVTSSCCPVVLMDVTRLVASGVQGDTTEQGRPTYSPVSGG